MGSPDARPRSGWHAWRPLPGAEPPGWLVELAFTVECPPLGAGARWPQALLLGRAPGPPAPVSALVAAFQELEEVAGVGPSRQLGLVRSAALPGLEPVASLAVAQRLGAACRRGLPAPRPRRLERGRVATVWEAGPGTALGAWGPAGRSVQAVVPLRGRGELGVLAPQPGGALLVRAWRAGPVWGAVSALVLGSADARGLGREAARVARRASAGGWRASVLRGAAAVAVARAGDPRQPIPADAAGRVRGDELAALVGACSTLAAGCTLAERPGGAPALRPGDAAVGADRALAPGLEPWLGSPAVRRARLARVLDEPEEPSPPLPLPPAHR